MTHPDRQTTPKRPTPCRPAGARAATAWRGVAWRRLAVGLAAAIGLAGQVLADGGGWMMGGDPERSVEHIERMARHLAVEADASPEQQQKLAAIARAAAEEVAPLRDRLREHRRKTMALLAAPAIDRGQIEALRSQRLKDIDAMSQRVTQALADAAEVLTPEQRKKLAERIAQRHGPGGARDRHGPRHGGWGPWSQRAASDARRDG